MFGREVKATRDQRFEWLMIAYRMPKPQANEARLPMAQRSYGTAVFRLLTSPQKLELLKPYNLTHNLGPLRGTKAEGKAS